MIVISFLAALLILVLIGVTSYRSTTALTEAAEERAHTHKVIIQTHKLLIDMLNAETGHRGFIVTANPLFLDVHNKGVERADDDLKTLRELTRDNPAQQTRLDELAPMIQEKISEMQTVIAMRTTEGLEASGKRMAAMHGKKIMDHIRGVLSAVEEEENRLLLMREQKARGFTEQSLRITVLGTVIALLFVSIASAVLHRDIKKRQQAEAEKKLFFTLSLDMLCIADPKGYFKVLNPAFSEVLGWTMEELTSQPLLNFVHPDDHEITKREIERQVVRGERVIQFENRYRRKDGSYRVFSWKSVPQPDGMMYATARDVTELKKAEAELLRRNALIEATNKELESFSYSVSHDLRAPLRHIDGFVDLLTKHASALDDKSKRYLGIIADSAKQMGTLIDDLLVFSRMGRVEIRHEKVSLDAVVKEILDSSRPDYEKRNIEWKIGNLPEFYADYAMMRVVMTNLISNAIKYTGKRDKAVIEIGSRSSAESDTVVFVRDNGAGFDMAYAEKLFRVFQRLHSAEDFEGTGVGLANVHRIVLRHGGKVWAEGAVDQGASFYFSIPK